MNPDFYVVGIRTLGDGTVVVSFASILGTQPIEVSFAPGTPAATILAYIAAVLNGTQVPGA